MDSITHILSAMLWVAPVVTAKPVPEERAYASWREYGAVVLAALLPDADGVLGWIDPALYASYHRLFTHSIPGMILVILISALLARVWPEEALLPFLRTKSKDSPILNPSFARLAGFAAIGMILHFVGDWIGAWGIWPLWPLSRHDFARSWVNSLDPALLTIAVAAWAVQHLSLVHHKRKAAWVTACLWLLACAVYIYLHVCYGPSPYV